MLHVAVTLSCLYLVAAYRTLQPCLSTSTPLKHRLQMICDRRVVRSPSLCPSMSSCRWVTVGEAIALSIWFVAMAVQIWQGKENTRRNYWVYQIRK